MGCLCREHLAHPVNGSPQRLYDARTLGEYDAVILGDRARAVRLGFDELLPGRVVEADTTIVLELANLILRRREELRDLLAVGGLLVVRLREQSALQCFVRGERVGVATHCRAPVGRKAWLSRISMRPMSVGGVELECGCG